MKQWLVLLLIVILPVSPAKAETRSPSRALTLVCSPWPPYQTIEGKSVHGFSTDVVHAVMERLGAGLRPIRPYPWKRACMRLKENRADALFSAPPDPYLAEFATYPTENLVTPSWLLWKRSSTPETLHTLEDLDLQGKRIGIKLGWDYGRDFQAFYKTHCLWEAAVDDKTNFRKLSAGRLDFVVAELESGARILKSLALQNIVPIKDLPVQTEGLYLIFSRSRVPVKFTRRFSAALRQYKKSQSYHRLYKRYFIEN